jgi:very-short-patch-repair endonuclease
MGVLANDIRMAIQVEGPEYERQVVAMYERDEKLREQGWVVRYIPQRWLWENPAKVRQAVKQFVYS